MHQHLRRVVAIVGAIALFATLTAFGDGDYEVGFGPGLVPPTTFIASGGAGCYWERDNSFDIITNNFDYTRRQQIVTVPSSDSFFYTDGCGDWEPLNLANPFKSAIQPTPDGDWRVGLDMAVARWVAYPPAGSTCYWERSRDFLHELSSIIDNNASTDPQVVQFEPGDVAFTSSGCGVWQRIADDDPRGAFEGFGQGFDTIAPKGWAVDPNAINDPIYVDVYVDGQLYDRTTANLSRPDVGAALGVGANHGWSTGLHVPQGPHRVCAYAIGVGLGGFNVALGCLNASYDGNPRGNLENATGGTSLQVSGWALDPSTPGPIGVDVYVDGGFAARLTANQSRPDIATAYPGFGANHGFAAQLNVADGVHQVCTYAINQAVGTTNPLLGCRRVAVQGNPLGNIDGLSPGVGSITVSGWSFDPDTAASTHVHLYLDGAFAGDLTADQSRPDVASVYPAYGPSHGFRATVPVGAGNHTVCAYGINVGGGSTNPLLACRAFTTSGNPVGNLDSATISAGNLSVTGWAIDPDPGATYVHIYVDGAFRTAVLATQARADIGTAFPAFGPMHGFFMPAINIQFGGIHHVCAYAINVGAGTTNPELGCKDVASGP